MTANDNARSIMEHKDATAPGLHRVALEMLVAAGHVSQTRVDQALSLAMALPASVPRQVSDEALTRIAGALRRAGANLPAPEIKGTIESAMLTGMSIALAIVEAERDDARALLGDAGNEDRVGGVRVDAATLTKAEAVRMAREVGMLGDVALNAPSLVRFAELVLASHGVKEGGNV